MGRRNLPYTELEAEVLSILDHTRHMVLATAAQNRVTARTMSIVWLDIRWIPLTKDS